MSKTDQSALLTIAQELLPWMEERLSEIGPTVEDMDLYRALRLAVKEAGGFGSPTHMWRGRCICGSCGHMWYGVVEIPIEDTHPMLPLACSRCKQETGGPA